jgi:uncharacterized membrane protein YkoI
MMKNTLRRKTALALVLSLVLTAAAVPISAESAWADDDFRISNVSSLKKVSGLKASDRDNNEIELRWNPIEGASGYEVARYSVKEERWILLGRSDDRDFDVENLLSATAYSFRVRAFAEKSDGSILYGKWSSTYKTCTRPNEVNALRSADKTKNSITLKWNSVKRATGYQVYIYDKSAGTWDRLITTGKTSYTAKDLKGGTSYQFKVRPYRDAVNSRYYGEFEDISVKTNSSSSSSASASDVLDANQVKQIVLKDAGVSSSSATFTKVKLERDDGIRVYEIEFTAGSFEYEYEVHAVTGKIRDWDKESIYD